jgi:hypothetical protein
MARKDFKGTWDLEIMRDMTSGQSESDGTLIIGSTASADEHKNPHSGANDHHITVGMLGKAITFYQDGADPATDLYIYVGLLTKSNGSGREMRGVVKVKKAKKIKPLADGDDATWVATSGPGLLGDGEQPARNRRAPSTKKKLPVGKKGSKKRR